MIAGGGSQESGSPPQSLLLGLPPIVDAEVETLILGSFPSPASLQAQQYYAHRQNQFWRVLGAIFGVKLEGLAYQERQRLLLRNRVGVWDVYRRCQREGALDSAIQAAEPNDLLRLVAELPMLQRVCFNGKTSARFERLFRDLGYSTCVLPSTSPAYTLSFERKVEAWRQAWSL